MKDLEKKTELQALKHEEILLELESIRAKKERLMPLCPQCSSQTIQLYHSQQTKSHTYLSTKLMHNAEVQVSITDLPGLHQPILHEKEIKCEEKKPVELAKVKKEDKEINTESFDIQVPKKLFRDSSVNANIIESSKEKTDKARKESSMYF
jgi:hypothetical protein